MSYIFIARSILNRKRSSAGGERSRYHPHRNSASFALVGGSSMNKVATSTLQEDLMKLIGPGNQPIENSLNLETKIEADQKQENTFQQQDRMHNQKPIRSKIKLKVNCV